MSGPGSGLLAQFCAVDEATYGVAPALTSALFYAVKGGETLKGKKITKQGEGLYSGALHGKATRRVVTEWAAEGDLTLEVPARQLNAWLYRMFGSYGQTLAALTQDASTSAYKAVHAPGALQGNSFCAQMGVPANDGTVEPFTYVGCKIKEWELSAKRGEIAELKLTIDARNELAGSGNSDPLNASVPALQAYTEPLGGVFHFAQATLYSGGTPSTTSGETTVAGAAAVADADNISIKYTIPLDTERYFLGGGGFKDEQIDNGIRTVTGQFDIEFQSAEGMYDAYAGDTATTLELAFVGPAIGTGSDNSMLSILIPDIYIDGDPPEIAGPQIPKQTITWTGLDDDANNVVQATYWTLDTA